MSDRIPRGPVRSRPPDRYRRAVRLDETQAQARLLTHDHGVLCTVHPQRGPDAVPVAYAVDGDHLAVPVDTVKPKSSLQLQRRRNLELDPRASLLIEHWDAADWSQLWWVRTELRWIENGDGRVAALTARLAERYPQYAERPFAEVLVFRIVGRAGWAATPQ